MYVLSVLDVFSRYVFLRPATSKEPKEIKVSTFFLKLFLLLRIFICFSLLEQATYFLILETISAYSFFHYTSFISGTEHRREHQPQTFNNFSRNIICSQVVRIWVRVLLTYLRLDQRLIQVARVWVRVLLTGLRLGQLGPVFDLAQGDDNRIFVHSANVYSPQTNTTDVIYCT